MAGHWASLRFGGTDFRNDRGVELHFAVQREIGGHFVGETGRLLHFRHEFMLRAALRGEGEQGDFRLFDAAQDMGSFRRRNGDARQFLRRGAGDDDAIRIDQQTVVAEALVGAVQQEAGGDDLDAGLRLDDLQGGAEHVASRVDGAGDETVGVAELDHHDTIIHRIGHKLFRLFFRDAFRLAQFVEGVRVFRRLRAGQRIDDFDVGDIHAFFRRDGFDACGIAQQDRTGDFFLHDFDGGLHRARFVAFRQDDCLDALTRLHFDLFYHSHG